MSREEAAALAGMRHYGYTDEQIAFAEQPVIHTGQCEFIEQVGWQCESEDGKPLHPESVELNAEFEMAQVHIDAADACDAAHGIHRVSLDDATVERVARGRLENLSAVYTIKAGLQSNPKEAAWCYAFVAELDAVIEGMAQLASTHNRERYSS